MASGRVPNTLITLIFFVSDASFAARYGHLPAYTSSGMHWSKAG